METTKVLAECLLLLGPDILEVLVAEDDDTALGDQQGELVLLGIGQLRQLQARDLSADARCQLCDFQVGISLWQKVWLCRVCVEAAVLEVEQFCGRELGGGVVDREVSGIFGLAIRLE